MPESLLLAVNPLATSRIDIDFCLLRRTHFNMHRTLHSGRATVLCTRGKGMGQGKVGHVPIYFIFILFLCCRCCILLRCIDSCAYIFDVPRLGAGSECPPARFSNFSPIAARGNGAAAPPSRGGVS